MRNWYEPVGKHAVRLKVWSEAFWNIVDPKPVDPWDDPEYVAWAAAEHEAEMRAENAWLRHAEGFNMADNWEEAEAERIAHEEERYHRNERDAQRWMRNHPLA